MRDFNIKYIYFFLKKCEKKVFFKKKCFFLMCLYIDPEILQSKPRSQTMSLARSMSVEVLLNAERQTLPVTGEVSINPYADWMRNYISTQSPYTCTSGNALPIKELLQKGEFQSKPRDPFPYPTLDVGDFRLNVIGEDKNIITYIHNGIKYDPRGKESTQVCSMERNIHSKLIVVRRSLRAPRVFMQGIR